MPVLVLAAALLAASSLPGPALARPGPALISIIIDDLGNDHGRGLRALGLPQPLTYSILPHTPHAARLAHLAHTLGKEVLLHLPMASEDGRALGPGGLTPAMTEAELVRTVDAGLSAVPYASGISNHMGSLLTRRQQSMHRLMRAISDRHRLFFVDSRTTALSVAYQTARAHRIPAIQRDVFLDHERDSVSILEQLHRLTDLARRNGSALGIAHPYPETLEVLRAALPALPARGIELVPVSRLMQQRAMGNMRSAARR